MTISSAKTRKLSVSNPNNDLMQDSSLSGNAQGNILNKEKRVEVNIYIYIIIVLFSNVPQPALAYLAIKALLDNRLSFTLSTGCTKSLKPCYC